MAGEECGGWGKQSNRPVASIQRRIERYIRTIPMITIIKYYNNGCTQVMGGFIPVDCPLRMYS